MTAAAGGLATVGGALVVAGEGVAVGAAGAVACFPAAAVVGAGVAIGIGANIVLAKKTPPSEANKPDYGDVTPETPHLDGTGKYHNSHGPFPTTDDVNSWDKEQLEQAQDTLEASLERRKAQRAVKDADGEADVGHDERIGQEEDLLNKVRGEAFLFAEIRPEGERHEAPIVVAITRSTGSARFDLLSALFGREGTVERDLAFIAALADASAFTAEFAARDVALWSRGRLRRAAQASSGEQKGLLLRLAGDPGADDPDSPDGRHIQVLRALVELSRDPARASQLANADDEAVRRLASPPWRGYPGSRLWPSS